MTQQAQSFSERLKRVRSELKLSQEDFAHALGVSFATINRWENQKAKPSKLAGRQFEEFCKKMIKSGKLAAQNLE